MNIGELWRPGSKTFWASLAMVATPFLRAQGVAIPEGAEEVLLGAMGLSLRAAVAKQNDDAERRRRETEAGPSAAPFRPRY